MTCETFRAQFVPATDDASQLEHLRSCEACLNFAVERDDDVLFRAMGGEMVPPGGVDAFVDDVMREVRLRGTEHRVVRPASWIPRRLAVAATIAAMIAGTTFLIERRQQTPPAGPQIVHHQFKPTVAKPVIESYDSQKATIVEVPSDSESVSVVMVFDDSLPADL